MELNNIVINFNKIINFYEYKIKEYEDIGNKIIIIENNIKNIIINNETSFKRRSARNTC